MSLVNRTCTSFDQQNAMACAFRQECADRESEANGKGKGGLPTVDVGWRSAEKEVVSVLLNRSNL